MAALNTKLVVDVLPLVDSASQVSPDLDPPRKSPLAPSPLPLPSPSPLSQSPAENARRWGRTSLALCSRCEGGPGRRCAQIKGQGVRREEAVSTSDKQADEEGIPGGPHGGHLRFGRRQCRRTQGIRPRSRK